MAHGWEEGVLLRREDESGEEGAARWLEAEAEAAAAE